MNLVAISSRGSRKDFVDLYTILRSGPMLTDLFEIVPKKYRPTLANLYHLLESLTYSADAEREPMLAMLEPFDREDWKSFFVREARAIVLP